MSNTSSFDAIVDTSDTGPETTQQTVSKDNTNQQGNNDLLKNLTTLLQNKSPAEGEEETSKVDYSALFGEKPKNVKAEESNKESEIDGDKVTKSEEAPENVFLGQLNDDAIVDKLISSTVAGQFDLNEAITGAFDAETGDVTMTPELLSNVVSQAVTISQQGALRQTINLIRELVPAVVEQASHTSIAQLNNKQQVERAMGKFEGNKPLQQLVEAFTKGKSVEDGEALSKQVQALMYAINKEENTKNDKDKPVERNLSTFLTSVPV